MKERRKQTRIRPRKRAQEDPEADRSWGVEERVGRAGAIAQRAHGVWGMRQKAVSYLQTPKGLSFRRHLTFAELDW